jgi:hypothetical protein
VFEVAIGPAVALFLLLAAVDHLLVAAPGVVGWYERGSGVASTSPAGPSTRQRLDHGRAHRPLRRDPGRRPRSSACSASTPP